VYGPGDGPDPRRLQTNTSIADSGTSNVDERLIPLSERINQDAARELKALVASIAADRDAGSGVLHSPS
jgi:hypothetical protein